MQEGREREREEEKGLASSANSNLQHLTNWNLPSHTWSILIIAFVFIEILSLLVKDFTLDLILMRTTP